MTEEYNFEKGTKFKLYKKPPMPTVPQCTCTVQKFDINCPLATNTEIINMASHYERREREIELEIKEI